ncbi:MAG: hypothetical protein BWY74_04541 [Firmicutes bacterium ADurb.Bin419]|nr:MAG: hypothetical protein BWY74_04541 [Firmicutes bacterium ADurb.Bin419]
MDKTLVGNTGFVGSNLELQTHFNRKYNSSNISEAFETEHDLVVYAGVRAEKFLANSAPEMDFLHVMQAVENIKRMKFKKLVLISTVDVYNKITGVDENTPIDTEGLHPYGKNRYSLEQWVVENLKDYHIIRLPGLFGSGIKKNFVYDMINIIPSMLKEEKLNELQKLYPMNLNEFYSKQENGFYSLVTQDKKSKLQLKDFFGNCGFNALSFTDSRSKFQFYNLNYLWKHIERAMENGIRLLCLATEPVSAGELYYSIYGSEFKNEFPKTPVNYEIRTIYAKLFGGVSGYIAGKNSVMEEIREFVSGQEISK